MTAVANPKPKRMEQLKQWLRDLWQKMIHQKTSPEQIASGFAIGIFASCFPILPFDTPVAIALAWLFRRNVLAAVTATTVTLVAVPLVPFLWLAAYHLGRLIVPAKSIVRFDHTNLAAVLQMGWDVYQATLVGTVLIATPIALISYVVIKRLVARWQSRTHPPTH